MTWRPDIKGVVHLRPHEAREIINRDLYQRQVVPNGHWRYLQTLGDWNFAKFRQMAEVMERESDPLRVWATIELDRHGRLIGDGWSRLSACAITSDGARFEVVRVWR